jgi:hypothetical protein
MDLGPVLLWGKLVFKANVFRERANQVSLVHLGELMRPLLAAPPKDWANVRGPLGAAVLSAKRVGWQFIGPFELETQRGRLLLPTTSPKCLRGLAEEAWHRWEAQYAAERLGLGEHALLDYSIPLSLLKP